jgi:hypothetical protein
LIEVEDNASRISLASPANDLVGLDVIAGPDAPVAQNAGLMVHGDDARRKILAPVSGCVHQTTDDSPGGVLAVGVA